jgi:hypothetical protein
MAFQAVSARPAAVFLCPSRLSQAKAAQRKQSCYVKVWLTFIAVSPIFYSSSYS